MLTSKIHPIPTTRTRSNKSAYNYGMETSNVAVAELLMQVHTIARREMMLSKALPTESFPSSLENLPLTPVPPPPSGSFKKFRARPSILAPPISPQPHRLNPRSRLISMDYDDDLPCCVTPTTPRIITTIGINEDADKSCFQDPIFIPPPVSLIENNKNTTTELQKKKKIVGRTLQEGVKWKGTLRKKFSWKSFPELEKYLVDHRAQYLEYSSSLNYTKAQKIYNNKLTQGLLDLAGSVGYTFEGFSFAAVRDRIRCFYKSYVQATKKKKRSKRSPMM